MDAVIKRKAVPTVTDTQPICVGCGDPIDPQNSAYVMLRGMWMQSTELGKMVFVIDPDTRFEVRNLPNGQLFLHFESNQEGPQRNIEQDCLERLADEASEEYEDEDEDEEDEDSDDEEEEEED